jgi:hypothetical protein
MCQCYSDSSVFFCKQLEVLCAQLKIKNFEKPNYSVGTKSRQVDSRRLERTTQAKMSFYDRDFGAA